MGQCLSTWIYSARTFIKDHVHDILLNVLHLKLLGQNQNLHLHGG